MTNKTILTIISLCITVNTLGAFDLKPECDSAPKVFDERLDHRKPPMHYHDKQGVMELFKMLDLSKTQKEAIQETRKELKQNRPNPSEAFTTESFDKAKYLEVMKNSEIARIDKEADQIEKVFAVLTPEQKKQFKTIMDMQQILEAKKMKFKGMQSDQDRNGGR